MPKGKVLTDDIMKSIAEIYLGDPKLTVKEVRAHVADRFGTGKWPGISAVGKEIKKIKEANEGLLKDGLESEWSLGASAKHNIPHDANRELIELWKWCVVVGRTFTIREAQWVVRLRGLVPYDILLANAIDYALRERACLIVKKGGIPDTADLDGRIAFKDKEGHRAWSYGVAVRTGVVQEPVKAKKKGGELALDGINTVFAVLMEYEPAGKLVELSLGLNVYKEHSNSLSTDGDMAYAMWLRRLSQGPKWGKELTRSEKENIADALYEEVAKEDEDIQYVKQSRRKKESEEAATFVQFEGQWWIPSGELLAAVGCKSQDFPKGSARPIWDLSPNLHGELYRRTLASVERRTGQKYKRLR